MPTRVALVPLLLPLVLSGAAGTEHPSVARPVRAESGRITGTVEVSHALTARRPRFRIYADAGPGSVPPATTGNDLVSELHNVVVYLQTDRGSSLPSSPAMSAGTPDSLRGGMMEQRNERFDPHVLPIMQGAQVEFPNRDDVYHNVFSLSRARMFDLGRYAKGGSKSVRFSRSGVVQVFCHIHSDMSAIVLVLANQFFAVPDSGGHYAIDDIPPGDYTIVGWHERTKPVSQRIRVVAGQTTTINFRLPLGTQPPT